MNDFPVDDQSFDLPHLFPKNYGKIKSLARKIRWYLGSREFRDNTTCLVHDVYLKLQGKEYDIKNEKHFFRLVAKSIRYTLLNEYERLSSKKNGHGYSSVTLNEDFMAPEDLSFLENINSLHLAISKMEEKLDARKASIVEMRFFGQMKLEEIAENLDVSLATVKRDLSFAKVWLYTELKQN